MTLTRRALLPLLLLPLPARAEGLDATALMARLAGVAERRATFREQRTLAALTTPLVSTGRLFYRRPDHLEKETLWPLPERMVIDGDRLVIADPASNEPPRVVPLGAQPGLRALIEAMRAPLAGDLATLRRSFALTTGGSLAAWTLDLTPTDPAARTLVDAVHLAGHDGWIDTIRIVQPGGDSSVLTIVPD